MIHLETGKYTPEVYEISERKGIGHPDTLCDLLAETLSLELSLYYLENFGLILHHNVDKILLAGGSSEAVFGGGEVTRPIDLFFAGRATLAYKGKKVPLEEIVHRTVEKTLQERFRFLRKEHFNIHIHIRPGSSDLLTLYEQGFRDGIFLANDTSCGVGYAPLSPLEQAVLQTESGLNSPGFKNLHPETGEDIKVMGTLQNGKADLTVAIAFLGHSLQNMDEYLARKEQVKSHIYKNLSDSLPGLSVMLNTADDPASGSAYITVTGTSAEAGDDGQVGRGNRANGLISPYHPLNLEAISGKNPVTHVGKIYNWAAMEIAEEIARIDEIEHCGVFLVSRIGSPVHEPQFIELKLATRNGQASPDTKKMVRETTAKYIAGLRDFGINAVRHKRIFFR